MPSKPKKKKEQTLSIKKTPVVKTRVKKKPTNSVKKVSRNITQLQKGKDTKSFFQFLSQYDLATWLFIGTVIVYLVTRLIGLTKFPIYFFTDEAIQTESIANLVKNNYRLYETFLPTYFRNGNYYNLSLSVYLQWLPYILFGKSAVLTRLTSILVTLIAVISVSIILRDIFKLKHWWVGALFLSITPAWFLHSRTAFETVEFVSFYTGCLGAYLLYLYKSPRYLYLALFFAACAFYTYSPAQFIVPITVLVLLISDARYHLKNERVVVLGFVLTFILGLPYLRFIFYNPHIPFAHLSTLGSYWLTDTTPSEKWIRYFSEYAFGLSTWYWYIPNIRDLPRHLMKDYGHILLATLPFAIVGVTSALKNLREASYRTVLFFMLLAPSASALVGIGITRSLAFIIPICIFTAIGFEKIIDWIKNPYKKLIQLNSLRKPDWQVGLLSFSIFLIGCFLFFKSIQAIDRIVIITITIILSVRISRIDVLLANWLLSLKKIQWLPSWNLNQTFIAIFAFIFLSGTNLWILTDSLRNGSTWYKDYGLGGMQYGGFQIFDVVKQYNQEHPDTKIIFSPDWANGADVLARFFLEDPLPIQIGSIRGHIDKKLPLDDSMLFVITPQEYQKVIESQKFTDLQIEKIVPYPDGNPGFYFIRIRYVDNVDEVFAAESAARRVLQESTLIIDGQEVQVRYSRLDSNMPEKSIALLFDGDYSTWAKTAEANPFVIELSYPTPRTINEFSIVIGSTNVIITLTGYPSEGAEPITYSFRGRGTLTTPELTFKLPQPLIAQMIRIEQLDVYAPEPAQNHIWEITFR